MGSSHHNQEKDASHIKKASFFNIFLLATANINRYRITPGNQLGDQVSPNKPYLHPRELKGHTNQLKLSYKVQKINPNMDQPIKHTIIPKQKTIKKPNSKTYVDGINSSSLDKFEITIFANNYVSPSIGFPFLRQLLLALHCMFVASSSHLQINTYSIYMYL